MQQLQVLQKTVKRLEKLGIEYYITGSMASNYYGLPRLTHDLYIVIMLDSNKVLEIVEIFSVDSHVSEEGIQEAFAGSGMFNIIDLETGFKVDFWLYRGSEFDESCFAREVKVLLSDDLSGWIATPEDVVLHKLYWNTISPSERQRNDARGVLLVQGERIDKEYLRQWATHLNIEQDLEQLLSAGENDLPNVT